MFNTYQLETVAYVVAGDIVCPDCYRSPDDEHADDYEQQASLTRYEAEEHAGLDGLHCSECLAEILPATTCQACGESGGVEEGVGSNGFWGFYHEGCLKDVSHGAD